MQDEIIYSTTPIGSELYVLGVDPGVDSGGHAVMGFGTRNVIATSSFNTQGDKLSLMTNLQRIHLLASQTLCTYRPRFLAIESQYMGFSAAVFAKLVMAKSMWLAAAFELSEKENLDVTIVDVNVQTWQVLLGKVEVPKSVKGKTIRGAKRQAVEQAARERVHRIFPGDVSKLTADAISALWIGHAGKIAVGWEAPKIPVDPVDGPSS